MSITDELRAYAGNFYLFRYKDVREKLDAIADRIDAEHRKAEDEWRAKNGDMWLKGYAACHEELMEGHPVIVEDLEKAGWVKFPVDADGVPIRVGDVMNKGEVTCIRDCGKGWEVVLNNLHMYDTPSLHHHAPTVEDVLRQVIACANNGTHVHGALDTEQIVDEYAPKLRLAGDAE